MYQNWIRRTNALIKARPYHSPRPQTTKLTTLSVRNAIQQILLIRIDSDKIHKKYSSNEQHHKTQEHKILANQSKQERQLRLAHSQTRRPNDAHVTCDSCRHQPPAACEHRMRDQRERNASKPSFRAVHSNSTSKSKQQHCKSHLHVTDFCDLIRHAHCPRPLYQPQSPSTTASSRRGPPQRPQSRQCCRSG